MPRNRDDSLLSHTELKYLLIDSIKAYTEDAVYISGNNPYRFEVNKRDVFILIHNIHDSGEGRSNPDECRIQVGMSKNYQDAVLARRPILFLGYAVRNNVFTAWDPEMQTPRVNLRTTISLYSKFSKQVEASNSGIAVYIDNDGQRVISFKPEYLGLYMENYEDMHNADESALQALIRKADETGESEEGGTEYEIQGQEFTVTHKKLKRDQKFRKLVADAYTSRCAFCGIQLEIVQAAHIVPHAHPEGVDDPTNGICLCSLHHGAYDNGLIYFTPDGTIKINKSRSDYLTKVSRDGGIQKFTNLHFEKITSPTSHIYAPASEFVTKANKLRGIEDEKE